MLPKVIFLCLSFAVLSQATFYDNEFDSFESLELPDDEFVQVQDTIYPLHYWQGQRNHGDNLIFTRSKHHKYWWKKNPKEVIHYPTKGSHGSRISMIEVYVNQTSNKGSFKVKSGGIGQNWVTFVIKGEKTKRFDWRVEIYGR